MYYSTGVVQDMVNDMTQIEQIEKLFFEARRSAFLVSFLCFIGTGISLSALSTLDPALGIVIPALNVMVLVLFTLFFLLLTFRLFQPMNEIVMMVNNLYNAIIVDEELEPVGAGAETEKGYLELAQQVKKLTKEIAVLKDSLVSSTGEHDGFWAALAPKWLLSIALVLVVAYAILVLLNMFFIIVGMAGVTIIALAYAHNAGRLKWPSRLRRAKGDKT